MPAILKRGEEMLTEGDPRHRANGGAGDGASAAPGNTAVYDLFDPNDLADDFALTCW